MDAMMDELGEGDAAETDDAPGSAPRYRALSAGVIRKEAAMDSATVGKLTAGEEYVALGTEDIGSTVRVHFERGWASVTAKSGKALLELVVDDGAESSEPEASDLGSDSEPEGEFSDSEPEASDLESD